MEEKQDLPMEGGKPYRVEFTRSPLHRYVPADGTWIGLNGHGKIILNFFNESPPLPQKMIFEVTSDGTAFTNKTPDTTYCDAQSFRQFDVSVVISVFAAKNLLETLGNFIKMAEEQAACKSK
jgi:hypothetical protein